MEANQQKILIGVGSVVGVLVLYFILAWSMSFWPFGIDEQKVYNEDLKISFTDDNSEVTSIYAKTTEAERKKELQDRVTNKVDDFVKAAKKLQPNTEPKEEDKKTSFNTAKTALAEIDKNQKSLKEHADDFFAPTKETASKATLKAEIKAIIDNCNTFRTQIKIVLGLK
ncbi:MAG: hypothetical protein ACLTFB_01395 [Candidatus Phytoplasma pyri]